MKNITETKMKFLDILWNTDSISDKLTNEELVLLSSSIPDEIQVEENKTLVKFNHGASKSYDALNMSKDDFHKKGMEIKKIFKETKKFSEFAEKMYLNLDLLPTALIIMGHLLSDYTPAPSRSSGLDDLLSKLD